MLPPPTQIPTCSPNCGHRIILLIPNLFPVVYIKRCAETRYSSGLELVVENFRCAAPHHSPLSIITAIPPTPSHIINIFVRRARSISWSCLPAVRRAKLRMVRTVVSSRCRRKKKQTPSDWWLWVRGGGQKSQIWERLFRCPRRPEPGGMRGGVRYGSV